MTIRSISTASTVAMALALVFLIAPVAGQATNTALKSDLPRMPDGHPDFQGTYDLATMTPLERWPGDPASLTKEKAKALERAEAERRAKDCGTPCFAGSGNPPLGGSTGAPKSFYEALEERGGGAVGGYNHYWLNQGSTYIEVNGQIRTSIIVDPPDGHLPPYNDAARNRIAAAQASPASTFEERQGAIRQSGTAGLPGAFDNPEQRPLSERCLLGFGSTSGPPALPDYFYNDLHQIVQTEDSIMILSEMIHDARIVRMNAQHLPKNVRRWMGDSVGHWRRTRWSSTQPISTTRPGLVDRLRTSTSSSV